MGFLLGTQSSFQAKPADLQTTDYQSALAKALLGGAQPQFDPTQANATAGAQNNLDASLQGTIAGTNPSVAQTQLANALSQNNQNNAAALASVRGMNPALAQRLIAQNAAASNQTAAGQGAQLRATELNNAQQTLANALAAQRGADISQASNATQLGIAGNAQNTNQIQAVGGLQNAQNNSQIQNQLGAANINADTANKNATAAGGLIGGLLSGGSAIGAAALKYAPMAVAAADGGEVPGEAEVDGDSPANDKVPAMLSPGEVVVPRSKATPDKAAEFVASLKKSKKPKIERGYGDVVASQRSLHDRLAMLEMACGGVVGMSGGGSVPAVSPQDEFLKRLGSAYLEMQQRRLAQPEASMGA